MTPSSEPVERTAPRICVVHAWITSETFALIEAAAERRGQHPDEMVEKALTVIAKDDLFGALLDL
jgi:hypothetical protein